MFACSEGNEVFFFFFFEGEVPVFPRSSGVFQGGGLSCSVCFFLPEKKKADFLFCVAASFWFKDK